MSEALFLLVGLVLGFGLSFLYQKIQKQYLAQTFSVLSRQALSENAEEFFKVAKEQLYQQSQQQQQLTGQQLEGKKELIDQSLKTMKEDLNKMQAMMQGIEKDRKESFGQLSESLKQAATKTDSLQSTTEQLKNALANTTARGQWGERMAEDVLRFAGMIEGINYHKQSQTEEGKRPDFTFELPKNRVVNMDVKFPLDSYMSYLNAQNDTEKENYRKEFLKAARQRVKESINRGGYISEEGNTLDYLLVFIPNEQVFSFLNEQDPGLLDEAMRNKVILCSPMTLYAILGVIRQAVDNFQMEKKSAEMISLLDKFYTQWQKYSEEVEKAQRQLETAQKTFTNLTGTRRSQLEKPLDKILELRSSSKSTDIEQEDTKLLG